MVKGVNGLTGGLHTQLVCQIEGLNGIIEGGRAIVGGTRSTGQSAWVDGRYWAILVADIGSEFSVLGPFATSMGLLATTSVVTLMSLGRSISARTAVMHQTRLVQ